MVTDIKNKCKRLMRKGHRIILDKKIEASHSKSGHQQLQSDKLNPNVCKNVWCGNTCVKTNKREKAQMLNALQDANFRTDAPNPGKRLLEKAAETETKMVHIDFKTISNRSAKFSLHCTVRPSGGVNEVFSDPKEQIDFDKYTHLQIKLVFTGDPAESHVYDIPQLNVLHRGRLVFQLVQYLRYRNIFSQRKLLTRSKSCKQPSKVELSRKLNVINLNARTSQEGFWEPYCHDWLGFGDGCVETMCYKFVCYTTNRSDECWNQQYKQCMSQRKMSREDRILLVSLRRVVSSLPHIACENSASLIPLRSEIVHKSSRRWGLRQPDESQTGCGLSMDFEPLSSTTHSREVIFIGYLCTGISKRPLQPLYNKYTVLTANDDDDATNFNSPCEVTWKKLVRYSSRTIRNISALFAPVTQIPHPLPNGESKGPFRSLSDAGKIVKEADAQGRTLEKSTPKQHGKSSHSDNQRDYISSPKVTSQQSLFRRIDP
ncbi:hypothetical protein CLF_106349 [Clonorchis sinensis]|uniref:Uncharacterized protein n=1 Tax=Clonorchis sinensis TaxID=79923 RepID=G7YF02_CLOSI|nr:hypothetical protein CLF_106349 [Clonorchis sinensis]